ncbi:MAG: glutamine-hydrolyzing carbamoyl-phosphate synthase small subunit [Alphaproteobacteria bacterium]
MAQEPDNNAPKKIKNQSISKPPQDASAVIVFADGTVLYGKGLGAETTAVGEICFNTSMTGYQEILTDPSYAGEIITFTFPHIGNVGTNNEDIESITPYARGAILRDDITTEANWRAGQHFDAWLKSHNLAAICGIDTRALTRHIRDIGAPNAVICHKADGQFDLEALHKQAANWSGLEGLDLAKEVSCTQTYSWDETLWNIKDGYGKQDKPAKHVVAMDFGAKCNILRCLAASGCKVTVVPGNTSAEDILKHKPDGVFLSNGPGDPAATGEYAVPTIKALLDKNMPIFGICLGHQMLALALGGKTTKMHQGHRGANHPVQDLQTKKVEITSQNHGFAVLPESLPDDVEVTHISLFDKTNEGIRHKTKPAFSVQYHPEASPGPQDSHYLFGRFMDMIKEAA